MGKRIISAVAMFAVLFSLCLSVPANTNTYAATSESEKLSLCELGVELVGENPETLVKGQEYTIQIKLKQIVAVDTLFFAINFDEKVVSDIRYTYTYGQETTVYREYGQTAVTILHDFDSGDVDETILQIDFLVKDYADQTSIWLSDINPAYEGEDLYESGTSNTLILGGEQESEEPSQPEDSEDEKTFQISLQNVSAESEAVIPLNITENTGVHALGLVITFDPNVCTFDRLSVSKEFKNKITLQSVYEVPGEGRIGASFLASDTMTDTGVFANVYFRIKDNIAANTVSTVQVEVVQAADEEETIVSGVKTSAAITVNEVDSDEYTVGDVNEDGKINLLDGMWVLRYYNGEKTLTSAQLKAADTTGDGSVTLLDALQIMRYFNGEITGF